jgi:hypothetical protein
MTTKFLGVTVAGLLLWSPIQAAQDQPPENESVAGQPVATEEEIRSLIKALADIEDPDVGFCPSMTGEIFAPVPSSYQFHGGILMNHGLRRSPALTKLVELGPQSLPLLLEALDDETPTQVTVEHSGDMGGMWYANTPLNRLAESEGKKFPNNIVIPNAYAWLNPANPRENQLFDKVKSEKRAGAKGAKDALDPFSNVIRRHTMNIGDICYVIIGQITNRPYLAAQYQMTACVYINSPVHDKNLASDVRGIWATADFRKTLLDSLLIDFNSKGIDWMDRRNTAALRLGFYFPHETEELFLDFLKTVEINELPVDEDDEAALAKLIEAGNKVGIAEAMSWSKSRKVRARLLEIMKSTADVRLFVATFPAIQEVNEPTVFVRCDELLKALPDNEATWSNDGWLLLDKMGERYGQRIKENYVKFLTYTTPGGPLPSPEI